jgi:hypothetical protein
VSFTLQKIANQSGAPPRQLSPHFFSQCKGFRRNAFAYALITALLTYKTIETILLVQRDPPPQRPFGDPLSLEQQTSSPRLLGGAEPFFDYWRNEGETLQTFLLPGIDDLPFHG